MPRLNSTSCSGVNRSRKGTKGALGTDAAAAPREVKADGAAAGGGDTGVPPRSPRQGGAEVGSNEFTGDAFQMPAETAVVQQRDEVEEEPAPAGAGQVELTGRRHEQRPAKMPVTLPRNSSRVSATFSRAVFP